MCVRDVSVYLRECVMRGVGGMLEGECVVSEGGCV